MSSLFPSYLPDTTEQVALITMLNMSLFLFSSKIDLILVQLLSNNFLFNQVRF